MELGFNCKFVLYILYESYGFLCLVGEVGGMNLLIGEMCFDEMDGVWLLNGGKVGEGGFLGRIVELFCCCCVLRVFVELRDVCWVIRCCFIGWG